MAASSARHMHAFSPQRRVYGSEEHIHSQSSEVSIEQEAKMERLIRRGRVSCTHPPLPLCGWAHARLHLAGRFPGSGKKASQDTGACGEKGGERSRALCAMVWCGVGACLLPRRRVPHDEQ